MMWGESIYFGIVGELVLFELNRCLGLPWWGG